MQHVWGSGLIASSRSDRVECAHISSARPNFRFRQLHTCINRIETCFLSLFESWQKKHKFTLSAHPDIGVKSKRSFKRISIRRLGQRRLIATTSMVSSFEVLRYSSDATQKALVHAASGSVDLG